MYIVHSIFNVPAEKSEEVIAIYQNRSKLVDQAPGFQQFRLLHNKKKPGELTVEITWEDKQSYIDWVSGDDFKRIHDLEKNYPDQELASIRPTVKMFEVVAQ
ncbi:antibiotic biosynthesis monooxygenase [Terribacillus sp. DMT04]|uniref:antibiotic biosynthesis monooxygenase family protein n=1 Tax=Terribacillus sp. DMT04 TaxID=2850441 RepID=UPI001C2C154F|nr:antibiotic biosynthesis monooxygenase family protein [Terribacillus sp. DMT04]QXE02122.1 antibiotic biosynthesis monooxygenase [Terribacillus sp. DMT04]